MEEEAMVPAEGLRRLLWELEGLRRPPPPPLPREEVGEVLESSAREMEATWGVEGVGGGAPRGWDSDGRARPS